MIPPYTYSYYLPILEGVSGQVYLNNGTLGSVDFDSFNGASPTPANALDAGIIKISAYSDALYQGRLSLQTSGSGIALVYNGAKWSPKYAIVLPNRFSLVIEENDVVWFTPTPSFDVASRTASLIVPPNAPVGPTFDYSGGSAVSIGIVPLVVPEVASVSPKVVTAGEAQTIKVKLARPLHASQTPNVVFQCPSGLVVFNGAATPNRNSSGCIESWDISVTPVSSISTAVSDMTIAFVEPSLTYLNGDVISTVTSYSYSAPITLPAIGISKAIVIEPPVITSVQAVIPDITAYGVVSTDGWTSISEGEQAYAGKIVIIATVSSTANNFSSGYVVAKATGTNNRFFVNASVAASLKGSPYVGLNISGQSLYFQDYYMVIDTGAVGDLGLNSYASYDVGFTVSADGMTTTSWINNTFVNQNLSQQFRTGYQIRVTSRHLRTPGIMHPVFNDYYDINYWGEGYPSWRWRNDYPNVAYSEPLLDSFVNVSIQELWGYKSSSPEMDSVYKTELYVNGPDYPTNELLQEMRKRDTDNYLITGDIYTTDWTDGVYNFIVRLFSKATTYKFDGVNEGFLDTPGQPLQVSHYVGTGGGGTGGGCFTHNTYVLTDNGPVKINQLVPGNGVITVSEANFKSNVFDLASYTISTVFSHEGEQQILSVNGVETTPNHPWAMGKAFEEAKHLSSCVTLTEDKLLIGAVILAPIGAVNLVYNIEVEGAHTYLVSNSPNGPWYLVHNKMIQFQSLD